MLYPPPPPPSSENCAILARYVPLNAKSTRQTYLLSHHDWYYSHCSCRKNSWFVILTWPYYEFQVNEAKAYTVNTLGGVAQYGSGLVGGVTSYGNLKVLQVLQTPCARAMLSRLDKLLNLTDSYVDYYLPEQKKLSKLLTYRKLMSDMVFHILGFNWNQVLPIFS